jgi:hypothetical protein
VGIVAVERGIRIRKQFPEGRSELKSPPHFQLTFALKAEKNDRAIHGYPSISRLFGGRLLRCIRRHPRALWQTCGKRFYRGMRGFAAGSFIPFPLPALTIRTG